MILGGLKSRGFTGWSLNWLRVKLDLLYYARALHVSQLGYQLARHERRLRFIVNFKDFFFVDFF